MASKQKKNPKRKKEKFYFVYFIIISTVVLLIFAFILLNSFWDYWSRIKDMENFYKKRAQQLTQVSPQINPLDPIKGQPDAKVTIFEYSDFLCDPCKELQADLTAIEKFYGNKVRFVFKGLPITIHAQTRPALLAAYCAAEQNAFEQYKNLLYQDPLLLSKQKYREYANELNLNMENFNQCMETKKYESVLNQNLTDSLELQITSVPTLYINDQKVEGHLEFDNLKNIIDQELKSL